MAVIGRLVVEAHISLHRWSAIVFAVAAPPVGFWQRLHKRTFADGRRQWRDLDSLRAERELELMRA